MIVVAPNQQYGFEPRGDYINSIVFLDGVKQQHCFYADDVAGVVKKFVFDEDENSIPIYSDESCKVKTLHGNVTIITRRRQ